MLKIEFKNSYQIINMGGPCIGDLFIDDNFIDTNIITDNIFYLKELDAFIFAKYHKISKWQITNYFTINIWERGNNLKKYSEEKFKEIYICKVIKEDDIVFKRAFFDCDKIKPSVLKIIELKTKD